jgi:site-specific recombinase XerD
MVAQGLSLKEIGDQLGHRSASATRIYAKVDIAGLRDVRGIESRRSAMRLSEAVARYVAHRKAMGMRFCTEKKVLKSFCRNHGETELEHIKPEQVRKFILGDGPATLFSHRKRDTLLGFYRFSTARGYTTHVPLPSTLPKPSANFVPYIFSQAELKRLLDTVDRCQGSRRLLQGFTFRTLLLLGLRLNEALSLTLADVGGLRREMCELTGSQFQSPLIL